ncbi:helix-turn-helix domain-containing protein [Ornithinimicrobium cavernae]|uniref:helix-turn-helix domain-containing protein n=1 Tax=Ornithinimicrobium cavernae TaxID=2666047 RepID=UPI00137A59FF|nr:helix-turn-helix transcriptional regulator [Ornithinimicrobium cavernae]
MSQGPQRRAPFTGGHTIRLPLAEQVSLAVRSARRRDGHSQRQLARLFGWSQSRVSRLETDPGTAPLAVVLRAVEHAGLELAVVDPSRRRSDPTWVETDLVARDRGGRRFPAHLRVVRCPLGPDWWWDQELLRLRRPLGPRPLWTTVGRDRLDLGQDEGRY